MNKLILIIVFLSGISIAKTAVAQTKIKNNILIQPLWGPAGYDYVEYYFIPDIDLYYNVPKHKFIYNQNGRWIRRSYLSATYNLYNCNKVVINETKPYLHHKENKRNYSSSDKHLTQLSIRDSHEPKYFEIKDHPEHYKWKEFRKNRGKYESEMQTNNQTELSNK